MKYINIKTKGKKNTKNTLNISFEGVNAFNWISSKNQSKDKNVSEESLKLPDMLNISVMLFGYLISKENTAVISCK